MGLQYFDKASELDPDFVMARLFRLLANEKRTDEEVARLVSGLKELSTSGVLSRM